MRYSGAFVAILLALALQAPPVTAAPSARVHKGMYACQVYQSNTGTWTWLYDLRFTSKTHYQQGQPNRGQTKIKHPHKGTYKVKGTKIVFKTGPERPLFGRFKPSNHNVFNLWRKPTKKHHKIFYGSCNRQHT